MKILAKTADTVLKKSMLNMSVKYIEVQKENKCQIAKVINEE